MKQSGTFFDDDRKDDVVHNFTMYFQLQRLFSHPAKCHFVFLLHLCQTKNSDEMPVQYTIPLAGFMKNLVGVNQPDKILDEMEISDNHLIFIKKPCHKTITAIH